MKNDQEVWVLVVTPEMAAAWLKTRSEEQLRRFRRSVAMRYVAAMKQGRWRFHGDAIDIDVDGRLSNGQHRLFAVVEAGMAQPFVVVNGVDREAFPTRDRGYSRSQGQILKWAGIANADAVATAAAIVWLEETGRINGAWSERADADVLLGVVRRHPRLEESVARANMTAATLRLSRGVAGWAYYRFSAVDESMAEQFFEALKTGADMTTGDPALVLRNRILSTRQARTRLHMRDVGVLLVRAWNHYCAGRKVKTLKASVRTPGESAGTFPEIVGGGSR